MKCPICKCVLPEDSLFCQYCGKEIDFDLVIAQEEEEADSTSVANNVLNPIIDNHVFCTKCGMKFEGAFCPVCGQPAVVKTEEFNAAVARINQTTAHIPVSTTKTINAPIEDKKIKTNTAEARKKHRERKKWGKKQWIISAGAFICAALMLFAGCYFYSLGQMDRYNYKTAEKWFSCIPAGDVLFPNASKYIGISKQLDAENYDSAIKTLSSLGNFRNAVAVKRDVVNKKIDSMISSGKYTEAIKYLSDNKSNIKDTSQLLKMVYYRWGKYYEVSHQYYQAYKKMEQAKGYSDADSKLASFKVQAYQQALIQYKRGDYTSCAAVFNEFGNYKSCSKYLALIDARTRGITDYNYNLLVNNLDFEDTKTALLSTTETAQRFLEGTWKGDGYYFKMKENGDISYDIPWFSYGDYYFIENGHLIKEKELSYEERAKALAEGTLFSNQTNRRRLFSFTIVSEDCIKVLAHKNDKTYTLYRQ